jgi:hypothetical protein
MVIVYTNGTPVQPARVAVTVMVATIGVLPLFVAVNAGTVPEPLAARPIEVLEFVHVKVEPLGVLVKLFAGTLAPLQ